MTDTIEDKSTLSEELAAWLVSLRSEAVPEAVRETATKVMLDISGLAVSARETDYVSSVLTAWEGSGRCTVIGQTSPLDAAGAALVNGTAAHGEDFDDTFEGAPLHAGAAGLPPVLAACERFGLSGERLLLGTVAAIETMCRLALVSPGAIHKAGFQPAAVLGAVGAAAGVGTALGLTAGQLVNAMGIACSFSSGLMEFLVDGAWTKRIHPGWAGQAGLRAALLAQSGFTGPRTAFEGRNGFYRAFARSENPDVSPVLAGLGHEWRMENLAFKIYPCGTMIGPYIDCAIALRNTGVRSEDISEILCKVAPGVAPRQWEPLAEKQRPPNAFAAKFSGPFGIAVGFHEGKVGLREYTEERVRDPAILETAAKVSFEIDPDNQFPKNYTGDLVAIFKDGSRQVFHQPHLRGGSRAPLTLSDLREKFDDNVIYGGWTKAEGDELAAYCLNVFSVPDLGGLATFRH